jgi:multiple sugar transport system substrate-binding protein
MMSETNVILRRPLYQQVAELLKEQILSGKLKGSLPTEDALGNQLEVSRVTIRKAMAELKNKGLICSYRGKGTFVSKAVPRVHTRVLKVASYYSNPKFEVQRKIYKGFEKRFPELKIEPLFCADSSDYCDFLIKNSEGRTSPDLFMFSESQLPYLRKQGIFRELGKNKFMGKKFDFMERPFDAFSKNKSKLYGVPFIFSPLVLFVNRNFFSKGTVPKFSTWGSLVAAAGKIMEESPEGYGFLLPYETQNRWPLFLLQRGVEIISGKGKDAKCLLDSPEAVETISWLTDLLYKHKITAGLYPDSTELFADGLGAVLLSSLFMLNKFEDNLEFDWEVLPVPVPSEGVANMLLATGFGISQKCEDMEAAEQFLLYLLSQEVQDLLASENVACPVRKSSLSYLTPKAQLHLDEILAPEILERAVLLSDHPEIHTIRQIMQAEMNKVWMKLQSPVAGCRNVTEKVNNCLRGNK